MSRTGMDGIADRASSAGPEVSVPDPHRRTTDTRKIGLAIEQRKHPPEVVGGRSLIVVEKQDDAAACGMHTAVPGGVDTAIRSPDDPDRYRGMRRSPAGEPARRVVGAPVIDDDHLEPVGWERLCREAVQRPKKASPLVVRRDDHRQRWRVRRCLIGGSFSA